MGWFYPQKKTTEWKQGCTMAEQTIGTASPSPTIHLLVILGIVRSFLWLSHYTTYKSQQNHTVIYFQLFLFLSPALFILFLLSYSIFGRLNMRSGHEPHQQAMVSPLKLKHTHIAATAITFLFIFILLYVVFTASKRRTQNSHFNFITTHV